MALRESPVFPGTPQITQTNFAASTAQTVTIFTAGSDGSVVTGINIYELGASSATVKLLIYIGSGTARYIGQFTLAGAAGTTTNLLKSSILPFIDDANPVLTLPANYQLQLEVPSVSNQLNVTVLGGSLTQ